MPKVTSKLQISIPKRLADQYDIHPGDEIHWEPAGNGLRLVGPKGPLLTRQERVALFDASWERQSSRKTGNAVPEDTDRGWTRDELYE